MDCCNERPMESSSAASRPRATVTVANVAARTRSAFLNMMSFFKQLDGGTVAQNQRAIGQRKVFELISGGAGLATRSINTSVEQIYQHRLVQQRIGRKGNRILAGFISVCMATGNQ